MEYSQENLGYLHQHTLEDIIEERANPEEFLNREAWPVVKDFLSDLGMGLERDYVIRLLNELLGSSDFAGSAGDIADSVNGERAIRVNPDKDMRLLPLMAHEAVHKYHSELKDTARDIGRQYEVFGGLGGFIDKMDIGDGEDFQYSSLAHQRTERLNAIGRMADKELEKWRERRKKEEEKLKQEYSDKFDELDLRFRTISENRNMSSEIEEHVTEKHGASTYEELQQWVSENTKEYVELREKEAKVSNLTKKAIKREMGLEGIDQESYGNPKYDEGFTMAVTLFASAGLDEEYWENYLESDHDYAEEPMTDIIERIYQKASETDGTPVEKMRAGMSIQDQNYLEGEKIV